MSQYYSLVRSVIDAGGYSLNTVLAGVERYALQGRITEDERAELTQLAQDSADPSVDVDATAALAQLAARVSALETQMAQLQPTTEPTEPTYPEWTTGMIVYKGDRVTEDGKVYEYIKNMPGSWAPSKKPNFWQLIE